MVLGTGAKSTIHFNNQVTVKRFEITDCPFKISTLYQVITKRFIVLFF